MVKRTFSISSAVIGHNRAMPSRWLRPLACAPVVFGLLAAGVGVRAETPTFVAFDRAKPGALPPGFRTLTSAESEPGRWQVERVDGAAALAQVARGRAGYRLAVLETPRLQNVRAGVRLRFGPGDRAAGLAWRVQDAGNYYAARLDLADDEFVVYKFVRGNRVRLSRLSGLRLDHRQWHELAIEHVHERMKVWLNGIPVASERDSALSAAGMVGLWLPGDSTAYFQQLWYDHLPPRDETPPASGRKRTDLRLTGRGD